LRVLGIIVVVQALLVYLGREVFNCYGLSFLQWGIVLVFSVSIIPADLVRKLLLIGRKQQISKVLKKYGCV
jgi:hypothetical protein